MKNLLTASVFLAFHSFAQVVKPIKINFKDKELIKEVKEIKRGEYYQLEIEDINMNLYKVVLLSKDTTKSEPLEIEKLLSFNTNVLFELLKDIVTTTMSSPYTQENAPPQITLPTLKKSKYPAAASISTLNPEVVESLTNFNNYILDQKAVLWEVKLDLEQYSKTLLIDLINSRTKDTPSENNFVNDLGSTVTSYYKSLNTSYTSIIVKQKELNNFTKDNYLLSSDTNFTKQVASISANFDKLLIVVEAGLTIITDSTLQKQMDAINEYLNNSSRTYKSLPIQFTEEQANLDISIVPIDPNSTLPSYQTTLQFPTINPYYISIGLGMYLSEMHDETISTLARAINDTTQGYTLVQELGTKNEFGTSIAARFGYRFDDSGFFGIHGMVGTGLSFTKSVRPRLMLGAGISLGDKHRLAIDGGFITGYSDRLSNAFNIETTYLENPANPVVSTLQKSKFLSIGYIYSF